MLRLGLVHECVAQTWRHPPPIKKANISAAKAGRNKPTAPSSSSFSFHQTLPTNSSEAQSLLWAFGWSNRCNCLWMQHKQIRWNHAQGVFSRSVTVCASASCWPLFCRVRFVWGQTHRTTFGSKLDLSAVNESYRGDMLFFYWNSIHL